MFREFGQAPLSLRIDLDSYEGSWTHVAAFRGGSGWLHVSRATIQSEHDLLSENLIAACDEQGNPIPAWRAVHLTECGWSRLEPCYDEPPALLDDLLCEEEGAFYARWQREMNADLGLLFDAAQRRIEALEAKVAARIRRIERQIDELRRRRRMADLPVEHRIALGTVIADLEAESDTAMAELAESRARLRREGEAAEEALWQRSDVLIEIEPRFTVRWEAGSVAPESRLARIWREGTYYAPPPSYCGAEESEESSEVLARFSEAMRASAEKALAERAKAEAKRKEAQQQPARPPQAAPVVPPEANPNSDPGKAPAKPIVETSTGPVKGAARHAEHQDKKAVVTGDPRRDKLERSAQRLRNALAQPGSHPKWRAETLRRLDRIERQIADSDRQARPSAALNVPEVPLKASPIAPDLPRPDPPEQPTLFPLEEPAPRVTVRQPSADQGDLSVRRAMLQAELEDLIEKGKKFLTGSPKKKRNMEQQAALVDRIARLGGQAASESAPNADRNWTAIEVDTLRRLWARGLSAGEIAKTIGRVSRNAVIGKAKRLGLPFGAQGDAQPRHSGEQAVTTKP